MRRPQRRRTGHRLLVVCLLWTGLVASLGLWWLDTPSGSLAQPGDVFLAAGRITGLVAGYLLVVVTVLRSRMTLVERWIGSELLTRWHREFGAALVVAALAHAGCVLVGYALIDGVPVLAELGVFVAEFEGMITAIVALELLIMVWVLAGRAVRARLPYGLWRALHATSYLALFLGFGHQLALGQQLFRPGPGRTWWTVLYAVAVLALVWGRLVEPLRLNLRHRFRVAGVVVEGPATVSVYLSGHRLHRAAQAGQFFRWRFLARGLWATAIPLSLSAAARPDRLRLTVRVVGRHTAALRDLRPGVRVWAQGPMGALPGSRFRGNPPLFIAAGSGIAPVRALLEELPDRTTVIYRESTARDVIFRPELERIAASRRVTVRYVIGARDDPAPRALLTAPGLLNLVPDIRERDVYLCGPDGFVAAVVRAAREAGVRRRQIHQNLFEL